MVTCQLFRHPEKSVFETAVPYVTDHISEEHKNCSDG